MTRRRNQSDNVDLVEKIQNNIKKERREKKRRMRLKFFKRLFTLLLIVSVGIGLFFFDQSEYSRIREIEVKGNQYIPTETLLSQIAINENDGLIYGTYYKLFNRDTIPGVANKSLKLYYTKGLISLTVQEFPVVGYMNTPSTTLLFSDNALIENDSYRTGSVPKLVGFDAITLQNNPSFADKLMKMDASSFNSISEIHLIEEPLEDIYFKLIMNNGYFVFTNLDNILLMDYYSDIVSGIQTGSKPDNRCIFFLDYGHTPDSQSAVSRPCED